MRATALALGTAALVLASGAGHAEVIRIKIANVAYQPAQVTAHVGDTIEWVNADVVAHTATARNGAFDLVMAPNGKNSIVLKTAGAIDYYCKYHPNMTGQISVVRD
jgi:plastocyanin